MTVEWSPCVILCAGQSNMVSTVPPLSETANALAREWKPDSTPETFSERPTSVTAFTCADELGLRLKAQVDYVLLATSGTSIAKWRASGPQFKRKVAKAAAAGVRPKAVFWWQGESDLDEYHLYAQRLTGLIAEWREAFGVHDLPFIAVHLWGGPAPYSADELGLRRAFEYAAEAVDGLHLVDVSDMAHWARHPSGAVRRVVARRAARLIHEIIGG